jgi:hypothetical protein
VKPPAEIRPACFHGISLLAGRSTRRIRVGRALPPKLQCSWNAFLTSTCLSRSLKLRKEDPATRWLDRSRYAANRLHAIAPDGEAISITTVVRNDLRRRGSNPTLIAGYGAYGLSMRLACLTAVLFMPSRMCTVDAKRANAGKEAVGIVGHGQGNRPRGHSRTTSTKAIAKIRTAVAPVRNPRSIGM